MRKLGLTLAALVGFAILQPALANAAMPGHLYPADGRMLPADGYGRFDEDRPFERDGYGFNENRRNFRDDDSGWRRDEDFTENWRGNDDYQIGRVRGDFADGYRPMPRYGYGGVNSAPVYFRDSGFAQNGFGFGGYQGGFPRDMRGVNHW